MQKSHKEGKVDDDKDFKALGELAAKSLVMKKIDQVQVLASSKIPAEKLSFFYRSFRLSNYEYSQKTHIGVEVEGDPND